MYKIVNLFLDRRHKLIKGLEIARITGLNGDLLTRLAASAIIHDHIYYAAHADLADIRIGFKTAFQIRLYAAAWSPVPCLRHRNALIQQHLDTGIIVIDGWHRTPHANTLAGFSQERIRIF